DGDAADPAVPQVRRASARAEGAGAIDRKQPTRGRSARGRDGPLEESCMPTTTAHAPGTFSWFELATTQQDAARGFYSKLFGYEVQDNPISDNEVYTIFKLAGRDASAAFTMSEKNYPKGTPPHWTAYLMVESADATAQKVKAAGGKVMVEPFDVME